MKKYLVVVAMVVALLLTLPGCFLVGGGDEVPEAPPATPASIPALQAEINTLKTQVSSLSTQLASVSVSPTDTSGIEANIAVLQTQIAELAARIAELELELEESDSSSGSSTSSGTWDTIKWYLRDVEMAFKDATGTYVGEAPPLIWAELTDNQREAIEDEIYAEVHTSPRTIQDEDLYDVELIVSNGNDDWDIALEDVVFVLTLSANGYAMLDEDVTYLDSDSSPYLVWESDFTIREREGKDVTRRVTFESDKLSELEVDANDYETLDLVLELYYA